MNNQRNIICIDLKSFFASVECIDRNLDPYSTPLVVCNPEQVGAITLAVSPYLKQFGVKGRTRVYDLPKNIKIFKAPPRMRRYQEKSKEVINIYLDFVAPEDIHVYSIDEVFLDVTDYLNLYKKTDYELALDIINTIYEKTKLTATAGIGPNLLLAKVAMDIEAKHTKYNIAKWTSNDIQTKLWPITPLSRMWGIGSRMETRLNALGFYKVGDIAQANKNILKKHFGILGEELWEHTNGIDFSRIKDFNERNVKDKSFSNSQVLFKDYFDYNINIIIYEMVDTLCKRLRKEKQLCGLVGFGISYSKKVGGGFYHSTKLDILTDDIEKIYKTCIFIFDKYYEKMPIRKVSISLGKLVDNNQIQLNLFECFEEIEKKTNINKTIDDINEKFGPNKLLKASSLLSDSTIKDRNNKIGGHNA